MSSAKAQAVDSSKEGEKKRACRWLCQISSSTYYSDIFLSDAVLIGFNGKADVVVTLKLFGFALLLCSVVRIRSNGKVICALQFPVLWYAESIEQVPLV